MLGYLKSYEATEVQTRDQGRPSCGQPIDDELVVLEHGAHDCGLHEQLGGACTWPEKGDVRGKAAGVGGVSPSSRERKMAISDADTIKCG